MSIGAMMMVQAAEARRRRDERGRYMEGDQEMDMRPSMRRMADNNEMRMPQNRQMVDERDRMRYNTSGDTGMKGEGYFVWDGPEHMPPERYGQPENRMDTAEMSPRYYSPYGDNPDVYKRQDSRHNEGNTSARMMLGERNVVDLETFAHKTDPLNQRDGNEHMAKPMHNRQIGFQAGAGEKSLDRKTIMDWVEDMEDSEGVRGGRYTWHQAQQYAMNKGITGEKRMLEFYAIMNAMYSDFHEAGKKFGVDKPEFYACLAKLFIEDPDAVDDKVTQYYEHVVKH